MVPFSHKDAIQQAQPLACSHQFLPRLVRAPSEKLSVYLSEARSRGLFPAASPFSLQLALYRELSFQCILHGDCVCALLSRLRASKSKCRQNMSPETTKPAGVCGEDSPLKGRRSDCSGVQKTTKLQRRVTEFIAFCPNGDLPRLKNRKMRF